VIFFTVVASMVAVIKTSDAVAPQVAVAQSEMRRPAYQDRSHLQVLGAAAFVPDRTVADWGQVSPSWAFARADVVSSAMRPDASTLSRLDVLLMFSVLAGFVGVQLRRAQDHLQGPFVSQ
jgi:hypothetical protein